jgi:hypothetical protein
VAPRAKLLATRLVVRLVVRLVARLMVHLVARLARHFAAPLALNRTLRDRTLKGAP